MVTTIQSWVWLQHFRFYLNFTAGTGLGLSWSFCHFLHNLFERTRFEYKTGHNTAPRCLHNFYFMSPPSSPLPLLCTTSLFLPQLLFSTEIQPIQLIFLLMQNLVSLSVADWERVSSRKCFMVIVWFYYLCGGPRPSNCNQASDRILHEWRHQHKWLGKIGKLLEYWNNINMNVIS